jgi:nicotinamidase-related amidase
MVMNLPSSLLSNSQAFLSFLEDWQAGLPVISLTENVPDPEKAAIISVDVTNGFCVEGVLSSPRVARIVSPIVDLFNLSWEYGIRNILLSQDTHEPDAVEFSSWPPHCVRGTLESETVVEIKSLPFYNQMRIIEKNSISTAANTGLNEWLSRHADIDTFIIVGDCTDLCTYQVAMDLRLDANANQKQRRVIVPADCSDTYDYSIESAQSFGGLPHPGELMHAIFLYHMALNGIQVTAHIR